MPRHIFALFLGFLSLALIAQQPDETTYVEVKTDQGTMVLKLYNETPQHRDNFVKLVKENFYDGVLFHRVIRDFMIQTGDPDSKDAEAGQVLGNGGPGYTLPAEFNDSLIHKKGALAAARQGDQVNPEQRSSGSQFYIVQGKKITDEQLDQHEARRKKQLQNRVFSEILNNPDNARLKKMVDGFMKVGNQKELQFITQQLTPTVQQEVEERGGGVYTDAQRTAYKTIGGTPHLDGAYTVFGEVVEGLDVVDKIAAVETGSANRPVEDVRIISMKFVKR